MIPVVIILHTRIKCIYSSINVLIIFQIQKNKQNIHVHQFIEKIAVMKEVYLEKEGLVVDKYNTQ